jgi:hypothetical protein
MSLTTRRRRAAQQHRTVNFEPLETRTLFAVLAFAPAVSSNAGADVRAIAPGDYNGDGKLDVVVANGGATGTVGFLAGSGDGQFATPTTFSAGANLTSLTSTDLNADGKRDLIIVGDSVLVALGNGDGTFDTPTQVIAAGGGPRQAVVSEVNGDGKLDVVVPNETAGTLSILFGDGDATFQPKVDVAAGTAPVSVATGDFDGDGDLDFAVANLGASTPDAAGAGVTILANDGSENFAAQPILAAGPRPNSIDVGPLNADGELDLVVSNGGTAALPGADSVSVFLGGDGLTFAAAATYATGAGPAQVRIGNLNLDDQLDVATANRTSNDVSVLLATGAGGTFAAPLAFGAGAGCSNVARADVNGDGRIDLVTGNTSAGSVGALLNESDPTPPTAAVDASQAAPAFGATAYDFTVTYSDVDGLDALSFGDDDLVVTGPAGGAAVPVTVNGIAASTATTYTVIYRLPAPGGTLDPADNGTYAVRLNPNVVRDVGGNAAVEADIGSFTLSVPDVPPGPLPELSATVVATKVPASVVAGAKGAASVTVTNSGTAPVDSITRVELFVSADDTLDGVDISIGKPVEKRLRLKAGASKVYKFKFTFPNVADGQYKLLGSVDAPNAVPELNETNNSTPLAGPGVSIRHAFVDLTGSLTTVPSEPVAASGPVVATALLANDGSVAVRGVLTFELFAADPTGAAPEVALGALTKKVNIAAGSSKSVALNLKRFTNMPTPGTYKLLARVDAAGLTDENSSNNSLEGSGVLTII